MGITVDVKEGDKSHIRNMEMMIVMIGKTGISERRIRENAVSERDVKME